MNAVNISQVKTVTEIIQKDLVIRASMLNDTMLDDLRFTVTTDVENIDKLFVFDDKGLIARQYKQGSVPKSQLGKFVENPAKVLLAVTHVQDNKQSYREKEPLHVNTDGTVVNAEQTTFLLNRIANRHKEDVRANLFFGNAANSTLANTAANQVKIGLSLYDGIYTKIAQGITKGTISASIGNLISTGDITGLTATQVYDLLVDFYGKLNPDLLAQEEVIIYCSLQFARLAIKGYMTTFSTLAPDVKKAEWKFAEMPNLTLKAHSACGKGGQLIATVPGNLEYVCDTRPESGASIEVVQNGDDTNLFDYQTQTAQGVRIRDYSPKRFAVNDAANTPAAVPAGDYIADIFTVSSADNTEGTVAITSGSKDLYQEGDIITVTATPADNKKFVAWSDGSTANPYNFTFEGGIMNLVANFDDED